MQRSSNQHTALAQHFMTKRSKKRSKKDSRRRRQLVSVTVGAATSAFESTSSSQATAKPTPIAFEAFPALRKRQQEHLLAVKYKYPPPTVRIRHNYPFLGVHSVRAQFFERQQIGARFKARGGYIVVDRLNREFNELGLAERQGVKVGDIVVKINGEELKLDSTGVTAAERRSQIKQDSLKLQARPLYLTLWRFEPSVALVTASKRGLLLSTPEAATSTLGKFAPRAERESIPVSDPARRGSCSNSSKTLPPSQTVSVQTIPSAEELAADLSKFYKIHNPSKLANIPAIVERFGRDKAGLAVIRNQLEDLYNATPACISRCFPNPASELDGDSAEGAGQSVAASGISQDKSQQTVEVDENEIDVELASREGETADSSCGPLAAQGSTPAPTTVDNGNSTIPTGITDSVQLAAQALDGRGTEDAQHAGSMTVLPAASQLQKTATLPAGRIDYAALVRIGFQPYDQTPVGLEYLAGCDTARTAAAEKAARIEEAKRIAAEKQRDREREWDIEVQRKIQLWHAEQATIRRVFHNDDNEAVTKGRPSQRMQRKHDRFGKQNPVGVGAKRGTGRGKTRGTGRGRSSGTGTGAGGSSGRGRGRSRGSGTGRAPWGGREREGSSGYAQSKRPRRSW
eukprot:INCI3714.1.p1 GENE.INCI3714.1~~INCI3714.1.p1  ORF type:complete len:629 (+),score=90.67 INCI3714.1:345-2231(+)